MKPSASPTGAQLAQTGACASHLPLTDWRTGALAHTSAPVAHSGAVQSVKRQKQSPENRRNPRKETPHERRVELLRQLAEANQEVDQAGAEAQPKIAAFESLDRQLRLWSLERKRGKVFPYQWWMRALSKRLRLGHEAHPFRKRWQSAASWQKQIVEELRQVNAEIGE